MKKRPAKPIKIKEHVLDIEDYLKCKNYRNYVLFVLGITTGYRAGDLVKLKARDIREALKRNLFVIKKVRNIILKILEKRIVNQEKLRFSQRLLKFLKII